MRVNHKTIMRLAEQAGADYKDFDHRYKNLSLMRYTKLLVAHINKRGNVALRQALINVLAQERFK
jgi:hypothetical protein